MLVDAARRLAGRVVEVVVSEEEEVGLRVPVPPMVDIERDDPGLEAVGLLIVDLPRVEEFRARVVEVVEVEVALVKAL